MLLCTVRRRHWKTVGLTAGLVAAFRSSRPSQEGKKRQRTDSCSGRGKAPTAARGTNTAERVPLPAEGTTCRPNPSSEPLPQPSRGGTGGVRDRWHGLTDQTKPHLWDLGKLWNCQYYWGSFLRTMTASQSSSGSSGSSKEDAGAGNGTPAPPPEGVPEATGNAKKKEDRRNEDPPDPGRGDRRPWVHPDAPEFAPRCCSCDKSGIAALAHQGEITTDTLATRGTGPDGNRRLAICLAPNTRGIIRGHDLTRRCGHTPCPRCTIRLEDQYMCACCAARVRAQGSAQHGAGRLPAPLPRANRRDRQGPRRLPPPRTGGRAEKEPAPERTEAKEEEDRTEADPPQEETAGRSQQQQGWTHAGEIRVTHTRT